MTQISASEFGEIVEATSRTLAVSHLDVAYRVRGTDRPRFVTCRSRSRARSRSV